MTAGKKEISQQNDDDPGGTCIFLPGNELALPGIEKIPGRKIFFP
jgi:hypothetical protein